LFITIIESCTDQLVDNGHFFFFLASQNDFLTFDPELKPFVFIANRCSVYFRNEPARSPFKTDQRRLIPGLVAWAYGPDAAKDLSWIKLRTSRASDPTLPPCPPLFPFPLKELL
jgi:hypothetical protein